MSITFFIIAWASVPVLAYLGWQFCVDKSDLPFGRNADKTNPSSDKKQ